MTVGITSNIVTKGLVLAVDTASLKGFAGPSIKNFATGLNPRGQGDNGSTYRVFSGTEPVYIPEVGQVDNCAYVDSYNDYNGGSGNCCPSLYGYGDGIPVTGSTLYTYGILYRSFNRYTHPNFMYHYEFNSSGTYLTEYGVHNVGGYSGTETHLGNGWYWARAKFTSQPTAASFNTGMWMYQYAIWNRIQVAKVVILQGDYMNLHPRFWPTHGTTRASTAGVLDLTGTHSVDATSAAYNTDGTINFNGSSSFLSIPNNTALDNQSVTVEVWVKTNATSQNGFWFEKGTVNTQYALFQEGGSIQWRLGPLGDLSTTTASYMNTSNWYQVVGTFTSGDRRLYINGTQVNSNATAGPLSINGGGSSIGVYGGYSGGRGYYYNGNLAICRVYNRNLSSAEVSQNFQANRQRFGI